MKLPNFALPKRLHLIKNKGNGIRNPNRDWLIILGLSTLVFVGVIAFSANLFYQINEGNIFKVENTETARTPMINSTALINLSTYYKEKENSVKQLQEEGSSVVDPSL
jgi:hypothetical protein